MFEAFFHVKNGKSPFSGNVFHGNPLLLYFLLLLKINKLSYFKSKFALHLLTSICDFIAAINLMEIVNFVETKDAAKSPKTKEKSTFSILIAILYVSNPFAIFNSIISFSTINYCLLFVTVKNALKRRTLSSCLFFSLLIFTEIYALLFFPLLIAIFYKKEETIFNKVSKIALLTLLVAFFVGTPIYLLSKEKGTNFLKESYLFLLSVFFKILECKFESKFRNVLVFVCPDVGKVSKNIFDHLQHAIDFCFNSNFDRFLARALFLIRHFNVCANNL
ncbi:hypothetical protein MHBO_000337 [Bonamia ostreae]